jgi:hypothetical protein
VHQPLQRKSICASEPSLSEEEEEGELLSFATDAILQTEKRGRKQDKKIWSSCWPIKRFRPSTLSAVVLHSSHAAETKTHTHVSSVDSLGVVHGYPETHHQGMIRFCIFVLPTVTLSLLDCVVVLVFIVRVESSTLGSFVLTIVSAVESAKAYCTPFCLVSTLPTLQSGFTIRRKRLPFLVFYRIQIYECRLFFVFVVL